MIGYLTDYSGQRFKLPSFLNWEITHTDGNNGTDCFQISCVYESKMREPLEYSVYFQIEHNNRCVFYGIIDEYEVLLNRSGNTVSISGRGMGARLIDNKCVGAEYISCTLGDMLRNYVEPYGITLGKCDTIKPMYGYSVETGASALMALTGYTRFAGDITPYFSCDGKLMLTKKEGDRYRINTDSAWETVLNSRRYGILSKIRVITADGVQTTVKNEEFIRKGGCAEGVITVPRNSTWDTIRYTGSYQIKKSKESSYTLQFTVKELFPVFPRDILEIDTEFCEKGSYVVTETCCFGDENSMGTRIYLTKEAV